MLTPRPRFLLISRVGANSLHRHWLAPADDRGFDVLLSSFSAEVVDPELPGVVFEHRRGSKVAGYAKVLRAHAEMIARYDYVALFDDDLMIDVGELTRLFDIVAAHDLKIAQPALTHDSHFTFAALLQDKAYRLRYVNYIEMMCPVFRSDVLQAITPLYEMGFESGIDLIWCNLVAETPHDFAVIDDVVVRHTRPVGTYKAANGFDGARRYEDDIYAILARFGLPWLSCVPYSAVRKNGSTERRRLAFLCSSLTLIPAIGKQTGFRHRTRSVVTYWKHLIGRKALNIRVPLPDTVRFGDGRDTIANL